MGPLSLWSVNMKVELISLLLSLALLMSANAAPTPFFDPISASIGTAGLALGVGGAALTVPAGVLVGKALVGKKLLLVKALADRNYNRYPRQQTFAQLRHQLFLQQNI